MKKFSGLFFWRKKKLPVLKESEEERQKRILTTVMSEFVRLLPQVRSAMNSPVFTPGQLTGEAEMLGKMFDFYARLDGGLPLTLTDEAWEKGEEIEDNRIEKTPKSVLDELEKIPTPITLDGIDESILLFQKKHTLTGHRYSKKQIEGFIQRLQNRKVYNDHKDFYEKFPNTTDGRIEDLIDKYKLVIKEAELFVPTFPREAVEVMAAYNEVTEKFTTEKPNYYVIAEVSDFKKKDKKDDPILLVQSPFGFYWQILGAWDKEMLLLSEL